MHVVLFQVVVVEEGGSDILGVGVGELARLLHHFVDVASHQQRPTLALLSIFALFSRGSYGSSCPLR